MSRFYCALMAALVNYAAAEGQIGVDPVAFDSTQPPGVTPEEWTTLLHHLLWESRCDVHEVRRELVRGDGHPNAAIQENLMEAAVNVWGIQYFNGPIRYASWVANMQLALQRSDSAARTASRADTAFAARVAPDTAAATASASAAAAPSSAAATTATATAAAADADDDVQIIAPMSPRTLLAEGALLRVLRDDRFQIECTCADDLFSTDPSSPFVRRVVVERCCGTLFHAACIQQGRRVWLSGFNRTFQLLPSEQSRLQAGFPCPQCRRVEGELFWDTSCRTASQLVRLLSEYPRYSDLHAAAAASAVAVAEDLPAEGPSANAEDVDDIPTRSTAWREQARAAQAQAISAVSERAAAFAPEAAEHEAAAAARRAEQNARLPPLPAGLRPAPRPLAAAQVALHRALPSAASPYEPPSAT